MKGLKLAWWQVTGICGHMDGWVLSNLEGNVIVGASDDILWSQPKPQQPFLYGRK